MSKYYEMSDFEIACEITRYHGDLFTIYDMHEVPYVWNEYRNKEVNINNPEDIMPIVFDKGIDIISPTANGTEYWEAHKFFTDVKAHPLSFLDKSPLRSAAIVFLMIMENDNE